MEDVDGSKKNTESYNFLLLSLYFYFKKNNFNETAEKIFQECKLDSIFKFPQNLKAPTNEKEKIMNEFIEFFYSNSFKNDSNPDILSDFWNQFWKIFANKMNMTNNLNIETLYEKEEKNISKMTYSQKDISSNFINPINSSLFPLNNNENLRTMNNLSNLSKNMNMSNNINAEEMANIINSSDQLNLNNNSNMKNSKIQNRNIYENNNNYMGKNIRDKSVNKFNVQINKGQIYDDEEEEEEINDIEKEMDEFNGIRFTNKNCPNIIKQENGEEIPMGIYPNEHDNDMTKNLYQGFQTNNSTSNFNLNAIVGQSQNNRSERNMSAIPLRKELENNNQEYDM